MDGLRFFLAEMMKAIGLLLLSLFAAKAVGSRRTSGAAPVSRRGWLTAIHGILYGVILALTMGGAWGLGNDAAARLRNMAAEDDLDHARLPKAYENALRAVELRPQALAYWRTLAKVKYALWQYPSLLKDREAFETLSGGNLDEEDALRFAGCEFLLGRYDRVLPETERLIRQNRFYAAPYVLQGMTYAAQKQYTQAATSLLTVLQMFPDNGMAVEHLAHVYFLMGDRARAAEVLKLTSRFGFPPKQRKRFEELQAFYAQ